MKIDLQAYSQFSDRSPFLYLEHAIIEQDQKSIALIDKDGKIPIPVCTIACLMIGPGTTITHQAVINATEGGCTIVWTGEEGIRLYATGHDIHGKSKNLLKQASIYSIKEDRLQTARKLYQMRFLEIIPANYDLNQIRGLEGNRVRSAYKKLSQEHNIKWEGRCYDRNNWSKTNAINRAITFANACLYGICTAAIVSLGYLPQIGFIHTGFSTAFVCDIADLYKINEFLPIAFRVTKEGETDIERRIRHACRDYIKQSKLMSRIVKDIKRVFDDSSDS